MRTKEKAKELVDRFEKHSKVVAYEFNFIGDIEHSVECALICVSAILSELNSTTLRYEFYVEVKEEIKKL